MSNLANRIAVLGIGDLEKNVKQNKAVFLDVQPTTPTTNLQRKSKDALADERPESDVIYGILQPTIVLSKIMGILPISRINSFRFSFNIASASMLYCTGMFAMIVIYIIYIQFNEVAFDSSAEGRFEEVVIRYLFHTYLIPVVLIPVGWYEAGNISDCLNQWLDFEKMYRKINGRNITLNVGNKALFITVLLPIIAICSMCVIHVTMVNIRAVPLIPYCFVSTITYMVSGYCFTHEMRSLVRGEPNKFPMKMCARRYTICLVISTVAATVADDFHKALKHIGPSSMVAEYRSLWLKLTKVTRDTGFASCYSMIFMCLYLFLMITLSIYGLLSQIQSGLGLKDVGLTITAALSIALLFIICDQAHIAGASVKDDFQKKLLTIELSWMNEDAQQEITMFLRATEMNPTDLSLGGFFEVNRSLFKSLMATMVTYLVVLLQFQISIPDDMPKDATNSTMH